MDVMIVSCRPSVIQQFEPVCLDGTLAIPLPLFPKSRGIPGVNDLRTLKEIIYFIRKGLPWRTVLPEYGL